MKAVPSAISVEGKIKFIREVLKYILKPLNADKSVGFEMNS